MPTDSDDDIIMSPPSGTGGRERGRRVSRGRQAKGKSRNDDVDEKEEDEEELLIDVPSRTTKSSSSSSNPNGPTEAATTTTTTEAARTTTRRSTSTSSSSFDIINDPDYDTMRIMISTDNHLGYAEDDNVRGNDSFAALEEVLYLAKHYRCDMVLLAGDLFHENRPTRRTIYKTMELFRRYCMGHEPIQIRILPSTTTTSSSSSGPSSSTTTTSKSPFVRGFGNYEDEYYSVDLPVFAIHGNHDDPSRDGGNSDLYAALDLLDVANLVNYFGKHEDTKAITVDPILFQKGQTHVALYGLGSMRDERLNRMWRSEQVVFSRPDINNNNNATTKNPHGNDESNDDENDGPNFFNIFALHQNRDYGRGSKNCVKEDMIPEWMDLVVWGHEHECVIELNESVVGTFRVTQPGSSVATSLVAGEAVCKKVGILDVRESNFRLQPIPLTQVRSFVMGSVDLAREPRLDPDDSKVDVKVAKVLEDKVRVLILNAQEKREELLLAAKDAGNVLARHFVGEDDSAFPLKHTLNKPEEVLVRLKVDHTGFSVVNNQRFGAKFVGQVANPTDILLFHRVKTEGSGGNKAKTGSVKAPIKPLEPEELEELHIEDLIEEQLESTDNKLQLLDEKQISHALESYVDKQQAQAINETISNLLGVKQKKLIKGTANAAGGGTVPPDDGDEQEKENNDGAKRKRRQKTTTKDDEEEDIGGDDDMVDEPGKGRALAKRGAPSRSAVAAHKDDYDDDDEEEEVIPKPKSRSTKSTTKTTARGGRKPAAGSKNADDVIDLDSDAEEVDPPPASRGSRRTVNRKPVNYSMDDVSEDDYVDDVDDDRDEEMEEIDEPPPTKRGRGKAATAAVASKGSKRGRTTTATAGSITPSTTSSRPGGGGLSQSQLSFQSVQRKAVAPQRSTKKTATASSRARGRKARHDDDDDSDFDNAAPRSGRSYDDGDDDDDWGTS